MHLHPSPINLRDSGLASAQSAENAASIRRARELREAATRLRASAYGIEQSADGETVAMIAAWSGQGSQTQSPPTPKPEEDALKAKPAQAVSYWA